MKVIRCSIHHTNAVLDILNDVIETSTAIYDYKRRTRPMMEAWFESKTKGAYPVIGLEAEGGELLGFASYGPFRGWPAYKYSVEHSVYVRTDRRGQGLGRGLMRELIAAAGSQDYHMMIGGIDAENAASIALHKSLGFHFCGSIKQAGFKFGRWLDLEFYQLLLPTPSAPKDG